MTDNEQQNKLLITRNYETSKHNTLHAFFQLSVARRGENNVEFRVGVGNVGTLVLTNASHKLRDKFVTESRAKCQNAARK
jgi:hypothetical protein